MSSLRCKICNSPHRREIERMLVEGKTYQTICEAMEDKIDLNLANISVHKAKHMLISPDSLRELTGPQAHLITPINAQTATPEELLEYVVQEAAAGIEALKLLPVSHYTLNARNNFLSTIRQIAETQMKASGAIKNDQDITVLISEQLRQRGIFIEASELAEVATEEEDERGPNKPKLLPS